MLEPVFNRRDFSRGFFIRESKPLLVCAFAATVLVALLLAAAVSSCGRTTLFGQDEYGNGQGDSGVSAEDGSATGGAGGTSGGGGNGGSSGIGPTGGSGAQGGWSGGGSGGYFVTGGSGGRGHHGGGAGGRGGNGGRGGRGGSGGWGGSSGAGGWGGSSGASGGGGSGGSVGGSGGYGGSIPPPTGGAGGWPPTGGTGGAGGGWLEPTCKKCAVTTCSEQVTSCINQPQCSESLTCVLTRCTGMLDIMCEIGCVHMNIGVGLSLIRMATCVVTECGTNCVN